MHITKRFINFSLVGFMAFAIDLIILTSLTELANVQYLASAAIAFICATSIQYMVVRKRAFKETRVKHKKGYPSFLGLALFNMLVMLSLLWFAVEHLHFNYLLSRIVIAAIVGTWNFLASAKFIFDVELIKP